MDTSTDLSHGWLEHLAGQADKARVFLLNRTMRYATPRKIYAHCAKRLATLFILLTLFYFPLALRKPEILLIFGPLVFGYVHLIASYWFVSPKKSVLSLPSFHFFVLATVLCFLTQFLAQRFELVPEMPFGAWEVMASVVALVIARLLTRNVKAMEIVLALFANWAILTFAWREPLWFVGGVLIFHNWVAFLYWVLSARDSGRRATAMGASILFGLLHFIVLFGLMDWSFPQERAIAGNEIIGWYLAAWSNDPVVWYRLVVLYAYGISMHYFIWLKAIPESSHVKEHPQSFRKTIFDLRQDLGARMLLAMTLLALGGMGLWCIHFPAGRMIYFGIATLHGWLEVSFLFGRLSAPRLLRPGALIRRFHLGIRERLL